MPQYSTRQAALNALKLNFFNGCDIQDPYAESLMIGALSNLVESKRENKFKPDLERAYRHLKSIAKCLGHWPITDEIINSQKVKWRLGVQIGLLVDNHSRKRYNQKKRRKWEIICAPLWSSEQDLYSRSKYERQGDSIEIEIN